MALGGGAFTAQNKRLPGAYLNFISVAKATTALSDRGIAGEFRLWETGEKRMRFFL